MLELIKSAAETIVSYGGAIGVITLGLRYVYKMARNVEKLVDSADENKKSQECIRQELKEHIDLEMKRDALRDEKDAERDIVDEHMKGQIAEIVKEIRPNGGSSMKDVLNATKEQMNEVHTRVAVLEQWKTDKGTPVELRKSRKYKKPRK
jgi:hypothetical protein